MYKLKPISRMVYRFLHPCDCAGSSGIFCYNFTVDEIWEQNTEKYILHVTAVDLITNDSVTLRGAFRVFGHQEKYFCSLNMINTGTGSLQQGGSLEVSVGKATNFTYKIDEEPTQPSLCTHLGKYIKY